MSDDNSFFEELQMDFLNESAFMLEQYEEYMMKLENSDNPAKDLTDIFRVAHSVKGGAAAVGLSELSKFAHVMEDLLDLLRSKPELVNSDVISILLVSGDELKNRVASLQQGSTEAWDPKELKIKLIACTEQISGKTSKHTMPKQTASSASTAMDSAAAAAEVKEAAPDDFFSAVVDVPVESNADSEDVTNHDLLAELLAQLSPEDQAEYYANEKADAEAASTSESAATPDMTGGSASAEAVTVVAAAAVTTPTPTPMPTATKAPSGARNLNSTIKVDTARVDSVLDAVGELVVLKNQLIHDETIQNSGNLRLEGIVDQLDKAVRELYEKTLSIRMTPLKSMFIKIQRIVRDVSINLDKPVDLELIGEETEVERTVFEILGDPLVHLVRNSMDHGVEPKDVRQERGKSAIAKVTVSAKQSGGNVIIDITDDGAGINREKVLGKAISKGLIPQGVDPASISDEQVFQFIFSAGFSTADKISDLSGRGVGLDVVKSNLDKINGKINIFSKSGQGSTFRLTIPLSTAITDGIIVSLAGSRYILPIHSIREIVRVQPKDYTNISGLGKVAKIREYLLPVIDIESTLGALHDKIQDESLKLRRQNSLSNQRQETMLIVIETINGQMAFPVDDVLGQAQVVVKPISSGFDIPEVAGAAILGDGRTVLILDPSALMLTHSRADSANVSSDFLTKGLAA